MLRYKAFLKSETIFVLFVSVFLSLFLTVLANLFPRDFVGVMQYFVPLGIAQMMGFLVVQSLRSRTILLLPVSPVTKYVFCWMRQFVMFIVFLLLTVLWKYLMACIYGGDAILVPIDVLSAKEYLLLIFAESLTIFCTILFRHINIQMSCVFVIIVGFALFGSNTHEFLDSGIVLGAILLLSVLLNIGSYLIFKRWQPADDGLLMI